MTITASIPAPRSAIPDQGPGDDLGEGSGSGHRRPTSTGLRIRRPDPTPAQIGVVQHAVRAAAASGLGLEAWQLADGHVMTFTSSEVLRGHVHWTGEPFDRSTRLA